MCGLCCRAHRSAAQHTVPLQHLNDHLHTCIRSGTLFFEKRREIMLPTKFDEVTQSLFQHTRPHARFHSALLRSSEAYRREALFKQSEGQDHQAVRRDKTISGRPRTSRILLPGFKVAEEGFKIATLEDFSALSQRCKGRAVHERAPEHACQLRHCYGGSEPHSRKRKQSARRCYCTCIAGIHGYGSSGGRRDSRQPLCDAHGGPR